MNTAPPPLSPLPFFPRHFLSLLILCMAPALYAQQTSGDFTFTSTATEVAIIGYSGPGGQVIIPSTIDGLPVTSVRGFTQSPVTGVTIPTSVTHIGDLAFSNCYGLTEIVIPGSVQTIAFFAFSNCTNLASVTLASGITTIGTGAFTTCESLAEIAVSEGVTSIGNGAFAGCTTLTTASFPASVTSLGNDIFMGAVSLLEISVHPDNPSYSTVGGVLFDKTGSTLIRYPGGKTGSYLVPDGVNTIESRAFDWCVHLTSLTIPATVTSIGLQAFASCHDLIGIAFLGNAPAMGDNPFRFSPAFGGKSEVTGITIPGTITSIGNSAFWRCRGLTEFTIPRHCCHDWDRRLPTL